jgi:hypothetical protein
MVRFVVRCPLRRPYTDRIRTRIVRPGQCKKEYSCYESDSLLCRYSGGLVGGYENYGPHLLSIVSKSFFVGVLLHIRTSSRMKNVNHRRSAISSCVLRSYEHENFWIFFLINISILHRGVGDCSILFFKMFIYSMLLRKNSVK